MVLVNRNVAPSFNTIIEILQNDQRKIKLIRKYENTRKKIINNECAILFNKTCIYIYIYIYGGFGGLVSKNCVFRRTYYYFFFRNYTVRNSDCGPGLDPASDKTK